LEAVGGVDDMKLCTTLLLYIGERVNNIICKFFVLVERSTYGFLYLHQNKTKTCRTRVV
jgi:hypothetical protein